MAELEVSDAEIAALMEELEAESAAIIEESKAVAAPEPDSDLGDLEDLEELDLEELEKAEAVRAEEVFGDDVAPEPEPEEPLPEQEDEPSYANVHVAEKEDEVVESTASKSEPDFPSEDTPKTSEKAQVDGLRYYVDVNQFRTDTRVTEATLDTCMIEQNGLRAFYGAEAARAEAQHSRLKAKFDVVEATLYDQHRKALAASGEKTTEKMVENAVKMDARWLKAKNTVIEAETIASINKSLVESLKDRRDMIIQLGADRRDEYKGAARVLAERDERESIRERGLAAAHRASA